MQPILYTIISVIIVSLISLIGVLFFWVKKDKLDHFLMYLVSFSVGALLGDVFLHILPEINEKTGYSAKVGLYVLLGVVIFFVIEKFVHWHHCHKRDHSAGLIKPVVYTNLIGDAFHNFLDGAIIAGSFVVSVPLGLATTLAVILHEIPQEFGDFGVLLYGGLKFKKALLFNLFSALTAIVGAVVTFIAIDAVAGIEMYVLALAAGGFIYIAGTDLIPELHKECRSCHSFYQFIAILAGIAVMALMLLIE